MQCLAGGWYLTCCTPVRIASATAFRTWLWRHVYLPSPRALGNLLPDTVDMLGLLRWPNCAGRMGLTGHHTLTYWETGVLLVLTTLYLCLGLDLPMYQMPSLFSPGLVKVSSSTRSQPCSFNCHRAHQDTMPQPGLCSLSSFLSPPIPSSLHSNARSGNFGVCWVSVNQDLP